MVRIAIHGFGRIGRSLMKAALQRDLFVPVSISDIKDLSTLAALFEVDSNYGRWPEDLFLTGVIRKAYKVQTGVIMPSRRMKSKTARKIRKARKGKARKRREQNKGTTPKFSIHIE